MEYNHKDIEGRIHRYWADKDIYRVSIDSSRPNIIAKTKSTFLQNEKYNFRDFLAALLITV